MIPSSIIDRYVDVKAAKTPINGCVAPYSRKSRYAGTYPNPKGFVRVVCIVLLSTVLLQAQIHTTGTAVIAIRTNDQVIIGADSRASRGFAKARVCKIIKVAPNVFCALAGVAEFHPTNCLVSDSIVHYWPKTGSIESKLIVGDSVACSTYVEMMRYAKQHKLEGFPMVLQVPIQVIFVGVENRVPFVSRMEYTIDDTTLSVLPPPKMEWDMRSTRAVVTIGENDSIVVLYHRKSFWSEGFVNAINKYLSIQATNYPDLIAPPFNILLITSRGDEKWVQRSKECK